MELMCFLESTLEIPLKASLNLKFSIKDVILEARRRTNLPSVELKCSFVVFAVHTLRSREESAYCQKSNEGNLSLSLMAN